MRSSWKTGATSACDVTSLLMLVATGFIPNGADLTTFNDGFVSGKALAAGIASVLTTFTGG